MNLFKVKMPSKIKSILDKLHEAGYEAYIVGGCVRDAYLGIEPHDWDIATSATPNEIQEIFKNYEIIGSGLKYGTVMLVIDKEVIEITTFRIDGKYSDGRRPDEVCFTISIVEDLSRRDFTINACAATATCLIDPFGGQEDAKNGMLRCVGDPKERFAEDALRILRGIRFAAQLDFDLHMATFEAMRGNAHLLDKISVERIREEFVKIVTAKNSGKGLRMCLTTGVLPYILGKDCINNVSKSEMRTFTELSENIDKADCDKECRLALVYLCFEKNKAVKAIDILHYDNKTSKMLKTAQYFLEDLSFITKRIDLKQFIFKIGYETYNFLESLSMQQRKVFNINEYKIQNRMVIYKDIIHYKEPIILEELAVDGDDLIEIGIKEGVEIGKMLNMLIDIVHINPFLNNKNTLLIKAKEFNKKD